MARSNKGWNRYLQLINLAKSRRYQNPASWASMVLEQEEKRKEQKMECKNPKLVDQTVELIQAPACQLKIGDVIVTMEGDNLGKVEAILKDDDRTITLRMRKSFMTFEANFPRMASQTALRFIEKPKLKTIYQPTPLKDLEVGDKVVITHEPKEVAKVVSIHMDQVGGQVELESNRHGIKYFVMGYQENLQVELEGVVA